MKYFPIKIEANANVVTHLAAAAVVAAAKAVEVKAAVRAVGPEIDRESLKVAVQADLVWAIISVLDLKSMKIEMLRMIFKEEQVC